MRHTVTFAAIGALTLIAANGAVAAGNPGRANMQANTTLRAAAPAVKPAPVAPPHTTGQPNQSCGSISAPNTPGNAVAAPGSAFNPDGKAGTVYAGEQPQNSRNPVSVSQYDVACAKQPSR